MKKLSFNFSLLFLFFIHGFSGFSDVRRDEEMVPEGLKYMKNISESIDSKRIESNFIGPYLNRPGNNGVSVGIIRDGKTYIYNYGFSDVKYGKMITDNSIYEIGSITKIFTGIILADEVVNGRLSLSDNIFPYLKDPDFESGGSISFLELSTHSSGLPRLGGNFWESVKDQTDPYADYDQSKVFDYLKTYSKPYGEPKYNYSNYGVGLLGCILCSNSNVSYEDKVRSVVTGKINMDHTFVNVPGYLSDDLVQGYNKGRKVANWNFQDATAGQGALRSSIHDMMKFLYVNLYPESSTISRQLNLTHEIHFTDPSKNISMGLGWHIGKLNKMKYLEHTGGTGGYRSFIGFLPEKKTGVVVLSNSTDDVGLLGIDILKFILHDQNSESVF